MADTRAIATKRTNSKEARPVEFLLKGGNARAVKLFRLCNYVMHTFDNEMMEMIELMQNST